MVFCKFFPNYSEIIFKCLKRSHNHYIIRYTRRERSGERWRERSGERWRERWRERWSTFALAEVTAVAMDSHVGNKIFPAWE